jgi:hypothetical protein
MTHATCLLGIKFTSTHLPAHLPFAVPSRTPAQGKIAFSEDRMSATWSWCCIGKIKRESAPNEPFTGPRTVPVTATKPTKKVAEKKV